MDKGSGVGGMLQIRLKGKKGRGRKKKLCDQWLNLSELAISPLWMIDIVGLACDTDG